MQYSKTVTLAAAGLIFFASCSKRLVGTWNVQKYETMVPGQQPVSLSNIGTITFNKDYTGSKNIHYSVFGTQRENTSDFTWSYTASYVSIKTDDSDFAKTWLIKDNNRNLQRWQSTDGHGKIQILELRR